jgi:integrase
LASVRRDTPTASPQRGHDWAGRRDETSCIAAVLRVLADGLRFVTGGPPAVINREKWSPRRAICRVDQLVRKTPRGGLLRLQNFRHAVFDRAARSAGLVDLTPHGLRHTAASLAVASGADVKVVQQMLGHASATMTLDLYGHLYGDRLDEVADRMDALRTSRGLSADFLRTEPQLIMFPELDRTARAQ